VRIFFVCSSFGGGGAEKVAVKLSSALADLGHDITYVYWKSKQGQEYKLNANVKIRKVLAGNPLGRAFSISSLIKKERPHAILSFTDVPNIITYYACIFAWPCRSLRVPNVRTNVPEKYRNLKKTPLVRTLSFLHGLSCRRAPLVLVNSQDSGADLCEYYQLDKTRVHCIYNPVFDSLPNEIPYAEIVPVSKQQRIRAINIGRLTQAKDQQMLVRAVDHAVNALGVDIELDIYGEGELHDELQSEITRCGLETRIFLKSFDHDIEKKLKNYHLFLFSSRWEGLPNALIEALGSGIEVISTDCHSGPREILDDGRFGSLVRIGNHQGMAEAISRIYPSGSYANYNNSGGRNTSDDLMKHLEKFTISFVTSQYDQLISRNINE
jgi:glycosyltransferase involved in cell wall biosynthesis